jgi:serine acetyltransferase
MHQGISTNSSQVTIGDETWVGINAVIMGNVNIGRHCVIGANAVVTRVIPDYCVAVGNPAKIIKMLDVRNRQWVRVDGKTDLDKYLADRCEYYTGNAAGSDNKES